MLTITAAEWEGITNKLVAIQAELVAISERVDGGFDPTVRDDSRLDQAVWNARVEVSIAIDIAKANETAAARSGRQEVRSGS